MSTLDGYQGLSRTDEAQVILPADAVRKRFATLQAQLALQGFVLRKIEGDGFICTRWGMCRDLPDLTAVERFAAQVGAA